MSASKPNPAEIYDSIYSNDLDFITSALRDHRDVLLSEGWISMLTSAVSAGNLQITQLLVAAGANVNDPVSSDSTNSPEGVIDTAASEGYEDVVRWLLDKGAEINHLVNGKPRCFALTVAAFRGRLNVVKLLVERGAWINCIWAGMTPLDHALAYGKQQVADYLRSVGAKTASELNT